MDLTRDADTETPITASEAGRRGGESTKQRHGSGFYRKIGSLGGRRTRELYGEMLKEFGKKGGRPRRPTLSAGEECSQK
jgi:general stress protein YciG